MKRFFEKYIGDKDFYSKVLLIVIPMIVQNLITNFVSMLDNIMVGQIGTAQMSGVSIVNQYIFILNITIFGAVAGPGIFGSQFFGKGDHKGQGYTFRYRMMITTIIAVAYMIIFRLYDTQLISLFLAKDDAPLVAEATLSYGREYMGIMLFSIIPFAFGQAYATAIRECGETKIPMYASAAAVLANLVLDYGLIFGKLGMPKLGVAGAAYATLVAKIIETAFVIIWAHANPEKNKYIIGVYRSFKIPADLFKDIFIKSLPLLFNEFLWVIGMSAVAQCYSVRGLDVVAARNIASTITNIFAVVYIQIGAAIGIIIGALLGAGKIDEATDSSNKLRAFAVILGIAVGLLMLPFCKLFPAIYNTEDEIKTLAAFIILIQALVMPVWSYTNACYFILRSGGRTGITFLFDFVFTWVIMIPTAFVLAYFTNVEIHSLITIVTFSEIIKVVIGYLMVRSNIWVRTIVE